jgi:hypothetical protein
MEGPSPRSKFNMPFVERRLDDPTGPDKQEKVDAIQYLLSKGITDEALISKICLESGWLNKPSGKNNHFGIKEKDITKGKLVTTTESLTAYKDGEIGLQQDIAKRGGYIIYNKDGSMKLDKEGKVFVKDRFRNYNNIEEAFDNFKDVNKRIIENPNLIYATDPNYDKKIFNIKKDVRYYLKNYSKSFGIPVKDNINNNFDKAHMKDITSADIVSTGIDSSIAQSFTKEQITNSFADNEYYENFFEKESI